MASSARDILSVFKSGTILFLSAGSLFILIGQLSISPLLPQIMDDLAITSTQAGLAFTVLWLLTAIAQYPAGRISDRLTRKTVLVPSLVVMVVAFVMLFVSPTYALFLVAIAILGAGWGSYETVSFAFIMDLFTERRGTAFGINISAVNLGSALAGATAIVVVWLGSWRLAFVLPAVALVIVTAYFHVSNTEQYQLSRVSFDVRSSANRVFTSNVILLNILVLSITMFIWQSTVSFLPTFLNLEKGFPSVYGSIAFSLIFVVGFIISPAVGPLGDRIGYHKLGLVAPVFGIVGLLVVLGSTSVMSVFVGVGIFGIGVTMLWPVLVAGLMGSLSRRHLGGDAGLVRTAYFALGSVGPVYMGVTADLLSYSHAFVGILVSFVPLFLGIWLLSVSGDP